MPFKLGITMPIIRLNGKVYLVPESDVERICDEIRHSASRCTFRTWYIRIHPAVILELLTRARAGMVVSDVLADFLNSKGLKHSLARVVTPTLSALGLAQRGVFTDVAEVVGSAIRRGEDVTGMIRALVEENCVLRQVLARVMSGAEPRSATYVVLSKMGKRRSDEIGYTAKLIEMAIGGKAVHNYIDIIRDIVARMAPFPNLKVSIAGNIGYLLSGERPVGIVVIGDWVVGDANAVKERLRRMDEVLNSIEEAYSVKVKLQPAVVGGERVIYVEAYSSGGERIARLIRN